MTTIVHSPSMRDENQFDSLGEQRDAADLEALYGMYSSLAPTLHRARNAPALSLESRGKKDMGLMLRLGIVHIWQEPRLAGFRTKESKRLIHTHNKPLHYPWSKHARDLFFKSKADSSSLSGALVTEHAVPVDIYAKQLQELIIQGCTKQEWIDAFLESQSGLVLTVITKEDNKRLDGVKLRKTMSADDPSPWARYAAAGLPREDFMALTDDPRWTEYSAANVK